MTVSTPERADLHLHQGIKERLRLPGPQLGKPLPSKIGSLAQGTQRFVSSLGQPVNIRRQLRGPSVSEAGVAPPRWWTPTHREAAPEPVATSSARTRPVRRSVASGTVAAGTVASGQTPRWLRDAQPVRRSEIPERALPKAVRQVPNEQSYSPGGVVQQLKGEVARVRRYEQAQAAGKLVQGSGTSPVQTTVRRKVASAGPRGGSAPASPASRAGAASASAPESPGPASRVGGSPAPVSGSNPPSGSPAAGLSQPRVGANGGSDLPRAQATPGSVPSDSVPDASGAPSPGVRRSMASSGSAASAAEQAQQVSSAPAVGASAAPSAPAPVSVLRRKVRAPFQLGGRVSRLGATRGRVAPLSLSSAAAAASAQPTGGIRRRLQSSPINAAAPRLIANATPAPAVVVPAGSATHTGTPGSTTQTVRRSLAAPAAGGVAPRTQVGVPAGSDTEPTRGRSHGVGRAAGRAADSGAGPAGTPDRTTSAAPSAAGAATSSQTQAAPQSHIPALRRKVVEPGTGGEHNSAWSAATVAGTRSLTPGLGVSMGDLLSTRHSSPVRRRVIRRSTEIKTPTARMNLGTGAMPGAPVLRPGAPATPSLPARPEGRSSGGPSFGPTPGSGSGAPVPGLPGGGSSLQARAEAAGIIRRKGQGPAGIGFEQRERMEASKTLKRLQQHREEGELSKNDERMLVYYQERYPDLYQRLYGSKDESDGDLGITAMEEQNTPVAPQSKWTQARDRFTAQFEGQGDYLKQQAGGLKDTFMNRFSSVRNAVTNPRETAQQAWSDAKEKGSVAKTAARSSGGKELRRMMGPFAALLPPEEAAEIESHSDEDESGSRPAKGASSGTAGDTAALVAQVVKAIEQRVIDELERRGRRDGRGR